MKEWTQEELETIKEDLASGKRTVLAIHFFPDDGLIKMRSLTNYINDNKLIVADISQLTINRRKNFYEIATKHGLRTSIKEITAWQMTFPDPELENQLFAIQGIMRLILTKEELSSLTEFATQNNWRAADIEQQLGYKGVERTEVMARQVARWDVAENLKEEECHTTFPLDHLRDSVSDEDAHAYYHAYYDERLKLVGFEGCKRYTFTNDVSGTYDKHTDTLFVKFGGAVETETEDTFTSAGSVLIHYFVETYIPRGFTVLSFTKCDFDKLMNIMSDAFDVKVEFLREKVNDILEKWK